MKTRTSKFIEAKNAVNFNKMNHIIKTATYYLIQNKTTNVEIVFDIVEVYLEENSMEINFIPNIKEM